MSLVVRQLKIDGLGGVPQLLDATLANLFGYGVSIEIGAIPQELL